MAKELVRPDDGLFIASLAKGFRVIEAFDGGRQEFTFAELVERSGIGKSATQRVIATLMNLKYLSRDEARRTYRVSHKFAALARKFSARSGIVEAGLPELNWLYEETGETVNITEREDLDVVILARKRGRHVVTISLDVGTHLPAFATAPGLTILAHEPEEIAYEVLARSPRTRFTDSTIVKIQELRGVLQRIRADGYFLGNQLRYEGEYSVAAPIFGFDGIVLGAINASVPILRWTEGSIRSQLAPMVMATAKRISEKLVDD